MDVKVEGIIRDNALQQISIGSRRVNKRDGASKEEMEKTKVKDGEEHVMAEARARVRAKEKQEVSTDLISWAALGTANGAAEIGAKAI